jgi:hypothetical protein
MKQLIQKTDPITIIGSIILAATVLSILILFFAKSNGTYIGNFIINS